MSREYKGWITAFLLFIALVICQVTNYADNKNRHTIIKTNIGEFFLKDGKMYAVYEMERNVKGELQVGIK
jgi:hypothetical protein